jgi:hypothetical protein
VRRQHQAELADIDALGLHAEVEVEHDRVGRHLLAFDMEVMLGEADAVVTVFVHVADLLGQLAEHVLVEVGTAPGHAFLDIGKATDGRQIKCANFHTALPGACPCVEEIQCATTGAWGGCSRRATAGGLIHINACAAPAGAAGRVFEFGAGPPAGARLM